MWVYICCHTKYSFCTKLNLKEPTSITLMPGWSPHLATPSRSVSLSFLRQTMKGTQFKSLRLHKCSTKLLDKNILKVIKARTIPALRNYHNLRRTAQLIPLLMSWVNITSSQLLRHMKSASPIMRGKDTLLMSLATNPMKMFRSRRRLSWPRGLSRRV